MNRTGAIPSASSILWGLALLLFATPLCAWLGATAPSDFFVMLAIVLGIIGLFSLANGVWAFLTTFDRIAQRYLGPATPGGTSATDTAADDAPSPSQEK